MVGAPAGRIWRIRDRSTFLRLRREGRRVRQGPVTVTWVPGDPAEPPRVAFAVGRRVGGAVQRNRVRRRLRAASTAERDLLRPGAYLIGADPAIAALGPEALRSAMRTALRRVAGAAEGPVEPR